MSQNTPVVPASVSFHENTLLTAEINGTEYAAMKPIVEGMGLDWRAQQAKIRASKRFDDIAIPLQTSGGIQEMVCIPIKKLNGWLFSVNSDKVKPEIREKVICYQEECFVVLYDYWHKGTAVNERALPPPREPAFRFALPEPGLTPEQQRAVQVLIGERVYATDNKAMYPHMFRSTYRSIKDKFLVAKYDQVPQARFEELMDYIDTLFAPVSRVAVSRDEFDAFVSEFRIRNKVMNEYLDDIWATGDGILSVAKRLGKLDGELTGIAAKAARARVYEGLITDIEDARKETQSILGSLLNTTSLFFVKHSKLNQGNPEAHARLAGRA